MTSLDPREDPTKHNEYVFPSIGWIIFSIICIILLFLSFLI